MRKTKAVNIGAIALLALVSAASAQERQVSVRISNFNPPQHPLSVALTAWANDVEKASNGSIKPQLFHAQQLGKAFDQYDMVRDGIADFAYVVPGYQPGRFPIIAAAELPFILTSGTSGTVGVDQWYRKYAESELKDVRYCFAFVAEPGTFHSRSKEIKLPSDLQGAKVRPAQATVAAWVASLGGTNVQAAAPEARDIIEKGVADVIAWPYGSLLQFGIDKFTKLHVDAPLFSTAFVFVMSKKVYAGFSENQRAVVDAHCNSDAARRIGKQWADYESAGEKTLRGRADQKFIPLTPESLKQWRTSSEPLVAKWKDGVRAGGGNPDEVMAELRSSLGKVGAAY